MDTLLETLRQLEEQLHLPKVRRDRIRLERLLHEDFEEIGYSGRHYRREDIIASLVESDDVVEIIAGNYCVSMLEAGIALLTYSSSQVDEDGRAHRKARRSSLWIKGGQGWQIRFHQGTPSSG